MNEKPSLKDIYAIFTRNPVLLPLEPGKKITYTPGWPDTTWEKTQEKRYQAILRGAPSIGILLGKNSSSLLFFDWDTPAALEWFLENHPKFQQSFIVTGRGTGGQVGGYCQGEYPANAPLRVPEFSPLAVGARSKPENGTVQIGEFRGDRLQSVLCGIHPDTKRPYSWPSDRPPIDFVFSEIKWHPDIILPWNETPSGSYHSNGDSENGPLDEACKTVTIDFLWKYFGFPGKPGSPVQSPFRDDNNPEHDSFSVHTDPKSGKQIFKDFHAAYADHKGDSYRFYQLASGMEAEALAPFMELSEALRNGETPPPFIPQTPTPELYIPPVAKEPPKPNKIEPAAYTGFLGEWVRYVEPQTECNADNLLLQMAVATGIVLGRGFYTFAGQELFPNLFVAILGPTGARKGTALVPVNKFYQLVAPDWRGAQGGWKSGEAVIHGIRDPRLSPTGRTQDVGEPDKRLLVEETELVHLFKAASWQGNTILTTLKDFWDSKETIATRAVKNPARVSYGHVGLIGHMTNEEFLLVNPDLITDGLINRVTWGNAFRARLLPNVQPIEWPASLVDQFRTIYAYAYRSRTEMNAEGVILPPEPPQHVPLDANAQLLWEKVYREPDETGTLAMVFKRYLAQALKFALIYAICERALAISRAHLEAGLAIASYSRENARELFSGFGPNVHANTLLHALKRNPEGLSLSRISSHVFNSRVSGDEIHKAILELACNRLISTQGRNYKREVVWRAV